MVKRLLRGEIYHCKFGNGHGSEQGGNRPVCVVSNDVGNRNSPTFIGAVVTSAPKKKYPMHVYVPKDCAGLTEDSTILMEQLFTIDKSRLVRFMGNLKDYPGMIEEVDEALKVSLELE